MDDERKTKKRLIGELAALRKEIDKLKRPGRRKEPGSGDQENFRALAEKANDGILISVEGRYVYANRRAVEITGFPLSELYSMTIADLTHPEKATEVARRYKRRLAGRPAPQQYETIIVRKDGASLPIELTAARTIWHGRPAGLAIIRDISRRREDQEQRTAILQERAAILDSIGDGLIMFNTDGLVVDVNPVYERMTGQKKKDVAGRPVIEMIKKTVKPEERNKALNALRKAINGNPIPSISTVLVNRQGKETFVYGTISYIRDDRGTTKLIIVILKDVTALMRTEYALRKSEKRYRAIVEDQTELVCRFLPDGTLTFANQAYCQYFGRKREDLIGRKFTPLIAKEDHRQVAANIASLSRRKPVQSHEQRTLGPEGVVRWQHWTNRAIFDEGGQLAEYQSVGRDITERKRAEEELRRYRDQLEEMVEERTAELKKNEQELRESKDRLQIIFDYAPEAYYLTDLDGKFLEVNKASEEISGYSRDDLLGKNMIQLNLLTEDQISRLMEIQKRLAGGQHINPVEFTLTRKDGGKVPLEISSFPVTIQGQNVILNIARDITERHAYDQKLRRSAEYFSTTFEQAAVGMAHVALDGHFIRINEKFCDIVGYSRSELLQRRFHDITHPDDLEPMLELGRRLLSGEISQLTLEKRYIHHEGYPVWVHLTSTLARNPSGQPDYFICVVENIGIRKWAEEELIRTGEQLKILFEYAPDAYLNLDPRGNILDCNRIAQEIFGYTRSQLRGKNILTSRLLAEEQAAKARAFIEELARGRSLGPQEFSFIRQNAEKVFVEVSAFSVEIEGQIQILFIARDITGRRRNTLRSQIKARLMAGLRDISDIDECLQMGCRAIHDAGLYQRAVLTLHNDRREITHLGQIGLSHQTVQRARKASPPDEKLRKRIMNRKFRIGHSFFVPAEAGLAFSTSRRYVPQKARRVEDPHSWRAGDELFVPLMNMKNSVEGYLSVDTPIDGKRPDLQTVLFLEDIADIVARQIHEIQHIELLRENEETTRTLMNATTDSAILIDTRGTFLAMNESAARRFGRPLDQLIGINGYSVDPGPVAESRRIYIEQVIRTRQAVNFKDQRKGFYFDTAIYPIFDANGTVARLAIYGRDITAEVMAGEEFRRSEQKYRELMDLLPQPVFEIDLQGRITLTNQAGLTAFGYRQEDVDRGISVQMLFPVEDRNRVLKNIRKRLQGEQSEDHEYTALRKDGTTFPAIVFSEPIIRDGQPVGLRGVVVDISERKLMENIIRESEEKFRGIAENVPDAIFTTDGNGRFTYMSPAVKDILGYRPEECIGKLYHAFLKSSDGPLAINYFAGVMKGERVRNLQLDMKRKNRTIISTELSATPRRSDGRITGIQGIIRDITDRVRAREEIERGLKKYRDILNLAPDAFITVDMKGMVTSCNQMFLKRYGLSEEGILNRPLWDSPVMNPKRKNKYKELFRNILRGEVPQPFEIEWTDATGKAHHLEIRISFLKEGRKKTGLQAILRDITRQKEIYDALEHSEARLRNLLDLAPDGIITMDMEGRVTSCNNAILTMAGHTRKSELIGKIFTELKPFRKINISELQEKFAAAIRGDNLSPLEFVFHHKDGTTRWAEGRYSLLKEEDRTVGILAIIRDITERKRDEQIQEVLCRISDAVHNTADLRQFYETIHQELSAFLKTKNLSISLFDHQEQTFTVEYHVDEKDRFEGRVPAGKTLTAYMIRINKPLLVTHRQIRELKLAGKIKPIGAAPKVWMGVPLRVEGKTFGALVVNDYRNEKAFSQLDLQFLELVSDSIALSIQRKRTETAMAESEELFRTLADDSPHMIYVNKMGLFLFVNKNLIRTFGYSLKELNSPDFDYLTIIAPQDRDRIKNYFARHQSGKAVPPYHCTYVTKRGKKIPTLCITKLIKYRGEPAILAIVTET